MIAAIQKEETFNSGRSHLKSALPFSYESIRIETGRRPIGFRFSKYITDISAVLNNREIIVCGESDDQDTGMNKAISELIERSALLAFGGQYGAETSNGWAAHPTKDQARMNAILELVERDAVLAQWYTKTPFTQLEQDQLPLEIISWQKSELSRSEFPILKFLISTKGLGPSVTCILMNKNGFGVSAHSTRATLEDAISSAISEACRAAHASIRKAHWKDTLKLKETDLGFVGPSAHALFYAYHEPFPSWMFGKSEPFELVKSFWGENVKHCLKDRRFCYQQVMSIPTHVGFAHHPLALTLKWQSTNIETLLREKGIERLNLKTEPINEKPHIVS
ncbi:MAG: YcaO-like family protein [Pseudomonadota bacterium]|nr:YcaO-like family protein [Pseudomonadota bacterium]